MARSHLSGWCTDMRKLAQVTSRDDQDPPAVTDLEWIRREAAPQDALAFAASIPNGMRTAIAATFTLGGAVERSDLGEFSHARGGDLRRSRNLNSPAHQCAAAYIASPASTGLPVLLNTSSHTP